MESVDVRHERQVLGGLESLPLVRAFGALLYAHGA
jgi:hypothetical protein